MDCSAHDLLESVTSKTLHAQHFSKSSTQATAVLTDLLSRYMLLLATTAGKYAVHAGRTGVTARDFVSGLDELGLSVEELSDYVAGEGRELARYSVNTARRVEDLSDLRGQLEHGARQDWDDSMELEFAPYDGEHDEESDMEEEWEPLAFEGLALNGEEARPPSPILQRTHPHIPSFLPAFPASELDHPPSPDISRAPSPSPLDQPPLPLESAGPLLASSSSDYLARVPYAQSSLSAVPTWHLPGPPPRLPPAKPLSALPQKEPSLLAAMHHIISNPPNPTGAHPFRHRVAMALLSQTQTNPRWEPPDTLFSSIAPCAPRETGVAPTHPTRTGNSKADFPAAAPRPISSLERMTSLVTQQPSRIPDLARDVLPWPVYTRSTTLRHPPVLQRGEKDLLYGPPSTAPWNAISGTLGGLGPAPAVTNKRGVKREVTPPPPPRRPGRPVRDKTAVVKSKTDTAYKPGSSDDDSDFEEDAEGGGKKGKAKDAGGNKKDDRTARPVLPDAKLFATWDYEVKDYRKPLVIPRNRIGSVPSGITLNLGGKKARARSEIQG